MTKTNEGETEAGSQTIIVNEASIPQAKSTRRKENLTWIFIATLFISGR